MTTTKNYDYLNRLLSISSTPTGVGTYPLSSTYGYNAANQRTNRVDGDGPHWAYGYDGLGQVTSGKKYWADNLPVPGEHFTYAFDDIGNRTATGAGGDSNGANLRTANYTINDLNQYTSRTVPNGFDVLGLANYLATVTVHPVRYSQSFRYSSCSFDQPWKLPMAQEPFARLSNGVNGGSADYRRGEFFQKSLSITNNSAPVWLTVTTISSNNGSSSNVVGSIFVPQTSEAFSNDFDGNLILDGGFAYTWNAENRLLTMSNVANIPDSGKYLLSFTYDYMGRRVQKVVSNYVSGAWVGPYTNKFIYDGWNLVGVLNGSKKLLYSFNCGSDLSGSIQGAGGVGGLISMTDYTGSTAITYFFSYDGNGNVMGLVKASDGTIAARYEYGPFGELLRATGPLAFTNPFRFSTKYQDDESGELYYGYRYYNASTGRWLSRDPIEEQGGANAYAFVENDGVNNVDLLGEKSLEEMGGDIKSWIQAHFNGRGGISYTFPPLKFLVYAPPPVWLEANLTVAGEVFSCVNPQTRQSIAAFKVGVSVDGFVAVGLSLKKGQPGPRNERIPNPHNPSTTVKRKNAPGEPGSGFRERNRYVEVTATSSCAFCPKEGYTGIEGSAFLRGSAGLGWGYQFNVQKAIDNSFTDITSGWSVTGGRAWGTAGISLYRRA